MIKKQKDYYELNENIDNNMFLRIIQGLNNCGFQITISTELDTINNYDITHEIVDQIDKYNDILSHKNIYQTVGFIVLEGLEIDHITVLKNTKATAFYKTIIHNKEGRKELSDILIKSGLNPQHWLKDINDQN